MQAQEVCVSPQGSVWRMLYTQVLHVRTLTKDCSLRPPSSEASSMNMAISLWILPITNASAVALREGDTSHTITHKCTRAHAHTHAHSNTYRHTHTDTCTDTCTYTSVYTIYMYVHQYRQYTCTSVCTGHIYCMHAYSTTKAHYYN